MSILAINGGKKVRTTNFPRYNTIDEAEIEAVSAVLREGTLSKYLGAWHEDFYGGQKVQEFEKEWSQKFNAKHTVSVNSNTSGLIAALGACGIGLGDEVLVSPYSMAISATVPLFWNATPVFCDLDPKTYSLSTKSILNNISPSTKAIVVVHIFGCPSNMDEIMEIAKQYNLFVIEDCAQAPGDTYKGKQVGTIGDIGVFSLNYHKHIHTGEGGMCTTNSDDLANKMQLIRNHAESVVEAKKDPVRINMLGYNFRLTEIQAAIGLVQLKKLDDEVSVRQEYASRYNRALEKYDFIETTKVNDRTHVYYIQEFQFDENKAGVSRERFLDAVKAELTPVDKRENEGVPIYAGYAKPLYLIPLFKERHAYRDKEFGFKAHIKYDKGICPVVEELNEKRLWIHDLTRSPLNDKDVNDVISAYVKVCDNIHELC